MSNWNPSAQYRKVAEANRRYYAQNARMYDSTETCIIDPRSQRSLELDIDDVLSMINKHPNEIRALDACGGSGNVSIKLLVRAVQVTTCDISPHLLSIFQAKCQEVGLSPTVVCAEIGGFLSMQKASYDLVVFSSALHHLENIDEVLLLAFSRLNPSGLLFTIFDPTAQRNVLARLLLRLDYFAFKIHKQPNDFLAAILRRLRRFVYGRGSSKQDLEIEDSTLGVLAEYHVEQGIDDIDLVERLKGIGFEVVWHERYPGARYALTRWLLRLLNQTTAFKLLLKKAGS
jgi:2-polyprenyl-3-methyl-5-hydroxy-6-metoxy-1,4-benzoquinol methylase